MMRNFCAALLMGVACLAFMADMAEARGCRNSRVFQRGGNCGNSCGQQVQRHACGNSRLAGEICNVGGTHHAYQQQNTIPIAGQSGQLIQINGQVYRLIPQDQSPVPTRKTTP